MRRIALPLLAVPCLAALAPAQTRTIIPKTPPTEVPRGYSILGDTPIAPFGYTPNGRIVSSESPQIAPSLPPSTTMNHGAAVGFAGKLYTFGWVSSIRVPEETWVFDLNDSSWTKKSNSPTALTYAHAVVANGRIYVLTATPSSFGLLEYDPLTDSWTTRASPPTFRTAPAMAAVADRIYVFGGTGFWPSIPLDVVEEYDPVSDSWRSRANMPSARTQSSAAAIDGRVLVIGGFDVVGIVATCDEYDAAADRWRARAPLNTPRYSATAAAVGGKVICAGGNTVGNAWGAVFLETVEEYSPEANRWTIESRITPRDGAVAATVGDAIHLVGGTLYPIVAQTTPIDQHVVLRPTSIFYVFRKN